jgi:LysR family transcriptional regulator for bpeEF and oprC
MDRLRAIEYFVCTAETGSLSAAARALGVSPVAVSKLIAALEARLGVALFHRLPRGVVLTSDGNAYFARCRGVLNDLETAESVLTAPSHVPRGQLVIGTPPNLATYCVAPALAIFRARYPDIELHLRRAYRDSDLAAQGLDALIALAWLEREDLVAHRLAQTRFLICAAPAYWARAGVPIDPDDLARHDCLVYQVPDAMAMDAWPFEKDKLSKVVRLQPKAVCDEQGWLIADALAGGGVIRVIDLTVRQHIERGELVPVLMDWEAMEAPPIYVIYRSAQRRNPRVRAFVGFARDLFADLESQRLPKTRSLMHETPKPIWWRKGPGRRPTAAR